MLANARCNPSVVDTLPKRVISGLEVIPIKKAFESGEVLWEDQLWEIFPPEIKALEGFNLKLFVDKNGQVFTVEFSIPDEAFQKLDGFPKNTLKNFYHKLIKEKCEAFKEVDLQVLDPDSEGGRRILLEVCGSFGSGNEYTTIFLNKTCYDMFSTFSPWRLPKDEFNRLIKKNEAEMNSQKQEE